MPEFFRKIKMFILIFSVFFLLLPDLGAAQSKPESIKRIIVTGTGPVTAGNPSKARQKAISESLVTAVGIAMAEMMTLEMLTENFSRLNKIMYSRRDHFIQSYRVLTETQYNNLYRVIVEAKVSKIRIKQELSQMGFIIDRKNMPSILLLMTEQEAGNTVPNYWWEREKSGNKTTAEKALAETLKKLGFEIISKDTATAIKEEDVSLFNASEPDNEAVIALGKKMQTDFVIVGSSFAELSSDSASEDKRSFRGTVTARAVQVDTGEEFAVSHRTEESADTDTISGRENAISLAGALTGNDLALEITKAMEKKRAARITILVQGEGYLSNFSKFRKALTELSEVKHVAIKEMKAGEGQLSVECRCDENSLSNAIKTAAFRSLGIQVATVATQHITVSFDAKTR